MKFNRVIKATKIKINWGILGKFNKQNTLNTKEINDSVGNQNENSNSTKH